MKRPIRLVIIKLINVDETDLKEFLVWLDYLKWNNPWVFSWNVFNPCLANVPIGFLMFPGGMKREHWPEMVKNH